MNRLLSRLLWLVLAALSAGCTDARFGSTMTEHAVELKEGWQYRWGDSPLNEAGEPLWSKADALQGTWTDQAFPAWPKGKTTENNLWQRIRLPNFYGDQQVLFARGAWMVFEAYVDGKKIYSYGNLGTAGSDFFPGLAWHWIPLPGSAAGKYITFRFYSTDSYFGLYDGIQVGTRIDHLLWMLKRDLAMVVLGFVYLFLGFTTLFMYTRNRAESANLSFGCFAILMGVYENCRTYMKQLLLFDPMFWGNLELTMFFMAPVAFCWFVEHMIGPGPLKVTRRIWQVTLVFVAFAYANFFVTGRPLWTELLFFQYFFIAASVTVVAIIGYTAYRGHTEARLLIGGVVAIVLSGIHDVIVSIGWIGGTPVISHIGMFFLILSLAIIVGRRYFLTMAIRKNLELASAVQNLLLPKQKQGTFGPFEFSSYYQPHGRMSGDWMNFWISPSGEQKLLFGDVIGKGPRAALAVAAIAAFIEDSKESDDSFEKLIVKVGSGISKLFDGHITSTLSGLTLHTDGRVDLYNCGGVGWIRAGGAKVEHVLMPSSVLGFGATPEIAKRSFVMAPGECVFAFTDGVLEGTRAITKLVRALGEQRSSELSLELVFHTATTIGVASAAHADDRSIVAVRRMA